MSQDLGLSAISSLDVTKAAARFLFGLSVLHTCKNTHTKYNTSRFIYAERHKQTNMYKYHTDVKQRYMQSFGHMCRRRHTYTHSLRIYLASAVGLKQHTTC